MSINATENAGGKTRMNFGIKTAIRKAYKGTKLCQFEKLLAEQSRWNRKFTIAGNKLDATRRKIDKLSREMANEILKLRAAMTVEQLAEVDREESSS
jgi:hypothetical protein